MNLLPQEKFETLDFLTTGSCAAGYIQTFLVDGKYLYLSGHAWYKMINHLSSEE